MRRENSHDTGGTGESWLLSPMLRCEADFGLFRSSLDGKFLKVNSRLVRMLGYESEAELLAVDMARDVYADPSVRARLVANAQAHIRIVELIWKRKDGTPLCVRISAYPIRDQQDRPVAFEGYVEDVTEQKRVEEALRQTNGELQAIYDGMVDGLLLADAETRRFVRANAAISRILGYSQDELLTMGLEDLVFPQHVPLAQAAFAEMARGDRQLVSNIRCRTKDGNPVFLDIGCSHVLYHGRPSLIGFFRDVTERREAEALLEQERHALEQLLEMHEQERQLITYEIHDGLAQHLAGAILEMQAYRQRLKTNLDEAQKDFDLAMGLLQQGMAEARRLISGLRPPILDESGVVAAIEHLVWDARSHDELDIEFHPDVDFGRLASPLESAIYRVVHEGLTNARRHSKSRKLVIKLTQAEAWIRLEIRDWGIGFNPDEKADSRGLQSIRQRVRVLGGQLDIQSGPGKGTCISVTLPLLEVVPREDGRQSA
ncbi:MAG: PAS domain S-box protein [Thermoguttaceae bacterium]